VEAARAGEQGRGFAVVAAEVRALSQRSAGAAKEIKGLIQDSVRKVEVGSELVGKSGQTLEEIVTSVRRVTDLMAEIAATSREQSTGINQVNRAVAQMDSVVQQNAAQTEELTSTAQALAQQAQDLQSLVGQFKLAERSAPAAAGPARVEALVAPAPKVHGPRRQPPKEAPHGDAPLPRAAGATPAAADGPAAPSRLLEAGTNGGPAHGKDGFEEF
jgi:ABC-type transporter Mla subunit MlaD